ncbi:MAG: acyl-CoA desaturase [Cytophagales bacterium]|nr:acyl-CoA desaturase [Cytophagales bacterium]
MQKSHYKIKFDAQRNADFVGELKEKVQNYFKDNNLSTHANTGMVLKTIFMYSLYFIPLFMIYSSVPNVWQLYLLYAVMGLSLVGLGCAVQHDANHGAYSPHDWVNRLLGFTSLTLIGGNDYMWKIKHNILHHTYTNIYGKDEDISIVKFLRLSPQAPWKPIHRVQHILAWFAYCGLTIFWVFYFDIPKIWRYNGNGSPNPDQKHPTHEIVLMIAMKIFYVFYMLIIPFTFTTYAWYHIIGGFVLMHVIGGFLLTTIFQLAHVIEEADFPEPTQAGIIENAWFVHQLETTSNFDMKNPFLTWFIAGLNYQVEHHLFPKICSVHYPKLSTIVQDVAQKHGIAYHYHVDTPSAIASHYNALKKFSRP